MEGTLSAVTMTLALAALFAVGAVRALRRRRGDGPVRVTARVGLDARRALYLVEVDGRRLLLGAGEGPLSVLAELAPDGQQAGGAPGAAAPAKSPPAPVPAAKLLRFWGGR